MSLPEGNTDLGQMAKMFATKASFVDLEKRVKECEGKNDQADRTFRSHDDRISALETQYRSLASSLQLLDQRVSGIGQIPTMPTKVTGDTTGLMEMMKQMQF